MTNLEMFENKLLVLLVFVHEGHQHAEELPLRSNQNLATLDLVLRGADRAVEAEVVVHHEHLAHCPVQIGGAKYILVMRKRPSEQLSLIG